MAAVTAQLDTARSMLQCNHNVLVYTFDLTKAFDTIRHSTIMDKMALFDLTDNIYKCINEFFCNRYHCTIYVGLLSTLAHIQAIFVQGSGVSPVSYMVTAADLHPTATGNRLLVFADRTYLAVQSVNSASSQDKIQHIQSKAANNNLKYNHDKSKEIILTARIKFGHSQLQLPTLSQHRTNQLAACEFWV